MTVRSGRCARSLSPLELHRSQDLGVPLTRGRALALINPYL
jgi:hypothetical protein